MDMTIQELHSVATTINEIAEWLSSQFISDDSTAVEKKEETKEKETEERVRKKECLMFVCLDAAV